MKNKCHKCNVDIPNRVKIDNCWKTINHRKFCLICSPWGKHNTKSVDPSKRTLSEKERHSWKNLTDKQKTCHKTSQHKRAVKRKVELINMRGGKCERCGYDKCIDVFHFHHIDPSLKTMNMGLNSLWCKSWEKILQEFENCKVYCSNCHMEVHYELKNPDNKQCTLISK